MRRKKAKKQVVRSIQDCVAETLRENPFTTARQLVGRIREACNLTVSRSTANRIVKASGFTYKKAFTAVIPQSDPETAVAFCQAHKASRDIVCIDEAGFYVGDHPRRGYAAKGRRLTVTASRTLRRVKYTLLMAISADGVVHYEVLDHNCRKSDFIDFIERMNVPSGTSLLMDNIAFHKSKETLAKIQSKGCSPLFIPPYSPRFNAIENVFSMAKSRYRSVCPIRFQDGFPYKDTLKGVLHNLGCMHKFFKRVECLVDDVLDTQGLSFRGVE